RQPPRLRGFRSGRRRQSYPGRSGSPRRQEVEIRPRLVRYEYPRQLPLRSQPLRLVVAVVVHHVSPKYFGEEGGTTECTLTVTWRFEAPVPLIVKGGMART